VRNKFKSGGGNKLRAKQTKKNSEVLYKELSH